jgi:putative ABC transport system permease protein
MDKPISNNENKKLNVRKTLSILLASGLAIAVSTTIAQLGFKLVNQFSNVVFLAHVIALPVSYFMMGDWLNGFVYRIDMPYDAYLVSDVLSLVIANLAAMNIDYRAAIAKLVDSLSWE